MKLLDQMYEICESSVILYKAIGSHAFYMKFLDSLLFHMILLSKMYEKLPNSNLSN